MDRAKSLPGERRKMAGTLTDGLTKRATIQCSTKGTTCGHFDVTESAERHKRKRALVRSESLYGNKPRFGGGVNSVQPN